MERYIWFKKTRILISQKIMEMYEIYKKIKNN
jgi:hypothetical protein